MKIILKKAVANLGEVDEIVEVKNGYAINYLVPQGYAIVATPSNLKQHEETLRQRAHKEAKKVADAEALAAKTAQLADALVAAGVEVDKKDITVPEVKELGAYEAVVKVYKAVKATLAFEVVAE